MGAGSQGDDSHIVIKKYANRRLYNTATSSYVTLDHLARLIQEGVEFVVYDAKSGEDITRSVLTQIIVEEESKGENLLPIAFLRQLISFYGDNMRWMVPQYLEHMIQNFAENQDRMRGAMQDAMGNLFPFGNLEDMRKQNMAFFEQAMRVWSPFSGGAGGVGENGAPRPAQPMAQAPAKPDTTAAPQDAKHKEDLARLKSEVQALKAELESMSRKPEAPAAVATPPAQEAPVAKPAPFESKAAPPAAANSPAKAASPAAKAPAKAQPGAARQRRGASKTTAAAKAPASRRARPASTRASAAKSDESKKD